MKTNYQRQLDQVGLDDASKAQLTATLLLAETAPKKGKKPRGHKLPRLVPAIALICLLTVSACGIALRGVLDQHWNQESQPVYQKYSTLLNRSCTVDGWTMTLTDLVGDGHVIYLGIELQAPEGADLSKNYDFLADLDVFDAGGSPHLLSVDEETRTITYYCYFVTIEEDAVKGKTMDFGFTQLYYVSREEEDLEKTDLRWGGFEDMAYVPVTEEGFVFEDLTWDYPDSAVVWQTDVEVPFLDGTTTLTQVRVSPLGVTAYLDGGCIYGYMRRLGSVDGMDGVTSLKVYGLDGEVLYDNPCGGGSGSNGDQDEGHCEIFHDYQTEDHIRNILIDPDEISGLEINGVYLEMPQTE